MHWTQLVAQHKAEDLDIDEQTAGTGGDVSKAGVARFRGNVRAIGDFAAVFAAQMGD